MHGHVRNVESKLRGQPYKRDFNQPNHLFLWNQRINKRRYELVVTRPRGRGARGSSKSAAESTGRVSSPMPGRVVRVLAESGQDVEKVNARSSLRDFDQGEIAGLAEIMTNSVD